VKRLSEKEAAEYTIKNILGGWDDPATYQCTCCTQVKIAIPFRA